MKNGASDAIMREFHSSAIGGHSGFNKTNSAIRLRYWWPQMTVDIRNVVSNTKPEDIFLKTLTNNCYNLSWQILNHIVKCMFMILPQCFKKSHKGSLCGKGFNNINDTV